MAVKGRTPTVVMARNALELQRSLKFYHRILALAQSQRSQRISQQAAEICL